ncbi:1-phosphofructokinase family hexose kinase [Mycetocola reblochoni]|uniref:1-phosphofructokinase n=2 Tax=Mycetocola reblochoni TaxID=331618 RepID=A0A1R4IV79_9MICO|nr:1-phosphofructokinase family hexose kinase [Mycetocola reblochoni]RLP71026.1 1-phosphofructokinase family hexose kinase [Mycetocola reblochoni]SJN23485.1 1-phosphofructokinase [Mycetocola reblochoni REB411]
MIVTLTAHPAVDRTLGLSTPLHPGDVHTVASERVDAGGKGVNVARAVRAAGLDATAVVPVADGDPLAEMIEATGLHLVRTPVVGTARTNLTVVDPAGVTTKLNTPGAPLDRDAERTLTRTLIEQARGARWLVLAGSLPPGTDAELYVRIIRAVRAELTDAPAIAVDTSGDALAAVVAEARPELIKPNDEEIAALTGSGHPTAGAGSAPTVEQAIELARGLVPARVGAVLLTLGSHGAALLADGVALRARAPRITVASTVGAGDSSLAGYLIAESSGRSPQDRLRTAVAYGAVAATLPGTQPPTPDAIPAWDIPVTPID